MKTALVTGASSGIGAATARRLLADGYAVYAGARRIERMSELASAGATVLALDVTREADVRAAVERPIAEHGRIDVLVNNAGYGSFGAVEDVPLDEARRQFEVNVFGLALLTQAVTPHMRRERSGTIVNVTSMGGKIYEAMGGWYHASKFAVEGLSDCLRLELRPFGIDVIVIEPGAIDTAWSQIAAESVLTYSGASEYAAQARAWAAMVGSSGTRGSNPSVVADAIAAALASRRPKARYAMGTAAVPLLVLRKLLPDGAMDWVMTTLVKRLSERASPP